MHVIEACTYSSTHIDLAVHVLLVMTVRSGEEGGVKVALLGRGAPVVGVAVCVCVGVAVLSPAGFSAREQSHVSVSMSMILDLKGL